MDNEINDKNENENDLKQQQIEQMEQNIDQVDNNANNNLNDNERQLREQSNNNNNQNNVDNNNNNVSTDENIPDLRLSIEETPTIYIKSKHQFNLTRFVAFIFLFLYLFFSILLFLNNSRLTHKEQLLSKIIHLNIKENSIRFLYEIKIFLLFFITIIGFYSFIFKKYRLFLLFSLLINISIIFTLITLILSIKIYNQMGSNIDNRGNFINFIQYNIKHYDWFNIENNSTDFINRLQFEYNCCGGQEGYNDWTILKPENLSYGMFPISCCSKYDLFINNNIDWCTYEKVEKMPDCPTAFTKHLIDIQNINHAMNLLLFESLLLQIISESIFLFLIIYGRPIY